jgi:hypothetical protein
MRPHVSDTEASECICLRHQVSMEDGDHSACPVELLACPEHREEQFQKMGVFAGNDLPSSERPAERAMLSDRDGKPIVGFCLWCDMDFYTIDEAFAHNAQDSKACQVFQQWKDAMLP